MMMKAQGQDQAWLPACLLALLCVAAVATLMEPPSTMVLEQTKTSSKDPYDLLSGFTTPSDALPKVDVNGFTDKVILLPASASLTTPATPLPPLPLHPSVYFARAQQHPPVTVHTGLQETHLLRGYTAKPDPQPEVDENGYTDEVRCPTSSLPFLLPFPEINRKR